MMMRAFAKCMGFWAGVFLASPVFSQHDIVDSRTKANMDRLSEDAQQIKELVVGGRKAAGFKEVVAILGNGDVCTGTLVSGTQVLTAAHCICNGVSEVVVFGSSIDKADREAERKVASYPAPKTMNGCFYYPGVDVGLLWLDSPFAKRY